MVAWTGARCERLESARSRLTTIAENCGAEGELDARDLRVGSADVLALVESSGMDSAARVLGECGMPVRAASVLLDKAWLAIAAAGEPEEHFDVVREITSDEEARVAAQFADSSRDRVTTEDDSAEAPLIRVVSLAHLRADER